MENKDGFAFYVTDIFVGRILRSNKQESGCGLNSG
jgi:hypothetical protein